MPDVKKLVYKIASQLELNMSYMPFIKNGGLFIPTSEELVLGDMVLVDVIMPGYSEAKPIEGKVVWITPKNALYQIYQGVGIQLVGEHAKSTHEQILANLDTNMDVGGYVYGMIGESK